MGWIMMLILYFLGFFTTMYFAYKVTKEESVRLPAVGLVLACAIWPIWCVWILLDMFARDDRL